MIRHSPTAPPPVAHGPRFAVHALNGPLPRRALDTAGRFVQHRPPTEYRRHAVNRTELSARIAARSTLSRADAATAVDAVVSAIADALASGEEVAIAGFGKFTVRQRPARQGRNPCTGEPVAVAASKAPAFRASARLRDSVNRGERTARMQGLPTRAAERDDGPERDTASGVPRDPEKRSRRCRPQVLKRTFPAGRRRRKFCRCTKDAKIYAVHARTPDLPGATTP